MRMLNTSGTEDSYLPTMANRFPFCEDGSHFWAPTFFNRLVVLLLMSAHAIRDANSHAYADTKQEAIRKLVLVKAS